MKLDMQGNTVTTTHKICISNNSKDKYITTMPSLQWTDNLNLACCFDEELEAIDFEENDKVQELIGNELNLLIWTDTRKSIYEIN